MVDWAWLTFDQPKHITYTVIFCSLSAKETASFNVFLSGKENVEKWQIEK